MRKEKSSKKDPKIKGIVSFKGQSSKINTHEEWKEEHYTLNYFIQ